MNWTYKCVAISILQRSIVGSVESNNLYIPPQLLVRQSKHADGLARYAALWIQSPDDMENIQFALGSKQIEHFEPV